MARGWVWVRDPDAGGAKIPEKIKPEVVQRLNAYAEKHFPGKYNRLDVRFRGVFCYIDAYVEPPKPSARLLKANGETKEQYYERMRSYPLHLCRLRYFGDIDEWSVGFYKYSDEKYELCILPSGKFFGKPEEGLELSGGYLQSQ